jgi:sulfite reductase (NADPH) flavoprotein alpha-component
MRNVTVLFGTESGNAQSLAERAGEALRAAGHGVDVIDMQGFDPASLASLRTLLVITSTYGNGDPPSNAEALHAHLMKRAERLPPLPFSVCALGDTTYERFAQCGKDFDRRLEELGAVRVAPRVDCDVDYDVPFDRWLQSVQLALGAPGPDDSTTPTVAAPRISEAAPEETKRASEPRGTRRNPCVSRVLEVRPLTKVGSTRPALSVVLDTAELAGTYLPGDSIGVFPENAAELVDAVLGASGCSGDETVALGDESLPLRDALATRLEIQELDTRLVDVVRDRLGTPRPSAEERAALHRSHRVVDVLAELGGVALSPAQLTSGLRALQPRLYSVASSPVVEPDRLHLLVGLVEYELHGTARFGVASRWFSRAVRAGDVVRTFVQRAPSFRIAPRNEDMILVGPGTGVAPYRAFLQERAREKGRGRTWLFFGARSRDKDFYYEEEWASHSASGALTKLACAFSRDQAQKDYVQHHLLRAKEELLEWLRDGAFFYVCGDAHAMARDVHAALLEVLSQDQSPEDARAELARMEREGRYLKDVY